MTGVQTCALPICEFWGKVHFWLSLLFMNLIFQPMFAQGIAGMNRRMYDGGATYISADGVVGLSEKTVHLNVPISHAAFALALAQLWPLPLRLASATVAHADAVLNASVFGLVAKSKWRPMDTIASSKPRFEG